MESAAALLARFEATLAPVHSPTEVDRPLVARLVADRPDADELLAMILGGAR